MEFHLRTHKDHQRVRGKKCRYCGLYFANSANLLKHHRETHNEFFHCEICNEKFYGKLPLKMHKIRVHGEDSDIKCEICGKKFARPDQLRIHRAQHSSSTPEQCKLCGKAFKDRARLCAHVNNVHGMSLLTHDAEKASEEVGRNKKKPATRRIRTKNKEVETLLCTHCGKMFKGKASWSQHTKIVHAEKPKFGFVCTKCGKVCKSRWSLNIHLENHLMKEDPVAYHTNATHKCPLCDKKFQTGHMMRYHKLCLHKNKNDKRCQLVQCNICGTKVQQRSLQDHLDNHAGILKFQCEKCDKVFASRSRLYNHRMVHKDVEYQCEFCGASYKQKSYLKRHIANKHKHDKD